MHSSYNNIGTLNLDTMFISAILLVTNKFAISNEIMNRIFRPHTSRLQEARPDLTQTSGSDRDDKNRGAEATQNLFGTIPKGPPPQPKQRNELFFSHTSGVEERESAAILAGIQKIIADVGSRIKVKNFGAFNLGNGPFENTDWYQTRALLQRQRGHGRQISDITLDLLLRDEPYQKQHPHLDVMAFDHDMTSGEPDNNFVYGSARYPNYVMSVRRFRDRIKDQDLCQMALAVIAAHELGHNFGLVGRNFNWVNKLGSHCNGGQGPCLMEQVDFPGCRTIENQTRSIIGRTRWLCEDCLEEAAFKKQHLNERGILW